MKALRGPIASLDGLRAVAVATVLLAHVLEQTKVPNVVPGSFGVTVFFFLSGFLITTLMRLEHEQTGTVAIGAFYLRRAVRILPPFYLVLGLATLATARGWLSNTLEPRAVLAQALHLTNYWVVWHGWWEGLAPGTFIFWSLAVEEHFYLLFPWLFLLVRRLEGRRTQARALLGLALGVLAWRCVLVFAFAATKNRIYPATDTRFDSILFGCVLALWGNPALDASRLTPTVWRTRLLPLAMVGLLVSFAVRAPWFLETFRYTLQGVCLVPIYVVAVREPGWGVMRALNWRWVQWVGRISYPLYLVHPTLLEALDEHLRLPPVVLFAVAIPTCVGVAALIHVGVERPLARWRSRRAKAAGSTQARPTATTVQG